MLKSYQWGKVGWGGGGPCNFSVSPSPFGLDFGTLDFGLGLDNTFRAILSIISLTDRHTHRQTRFTLLGLLSEPKIKSSGI